MIYKKKNNNFFDISQFSTDDKLKNFTKYIKRKDLSRFLVYYELFKKQLIVKGSIVECGVHQGGGVFTWAKLSSILEPYNYQRKIIGFDTFTGFPSVSKNYDNLNFAKKKLFKENINIINDLKKAELFYDSERYLSNIKKIELIEGDATKTIPEYIKTNQHLIISLLFLDFDIFEPTKIALKNFIKRIPKGGIIAFDEVNNPQWPGETKAMLEELNIANHQLESFIFEPNISFIKI